MSEEVVAQEAGPDPAVAAAADTSTTSTASIEDAEDGKSNGQVLINGKHEEDAVAEFDEERDALISITGFSLSTLRKIRAEIEEVIKNTIKKMEVDTSDRLESDLKCLRFYKDFIIDRMGYQVRSGETAITEGWCVPRYENEYQNLLGLPFTEDHAMSETLRRARPRQECFNCLATSHRIQECPVKVDEERVAFHRKQFNAQSMQRQEEAQLFSNRYTKDQDATNRGFTPGTISAPLREALGLRQDQLPPFIYYMRKYGYPIGWLMEAQVKKTNLAVHNGDQATVTSLPEGEALDSSVNEAAPVEYDPELILSIPGFNLPIPEGFVDETDRYHVPRYSSAFSRENFLKTLPLKEKKMIGRRSVLEPKGAESETEETGEDEAKKTKSRKRKNEDVAGEDDSKNESLEEGEADTTGSSHGTKSLSPEVEATAADDDDKFISPKRRKTEDAAAALGQSFTEILGTPVVMSQQSGVSRVPDWEKFSDGICPHKPYEMTDGQTPVGSYKNIVKLTRDFNKTQTDK